MTSIYLATDDALVSSWIRVLWKPLWPNPSTPGSLNCYCPRCGVGNHQVTVSGRFCPSCPVQLCPINMAVLRKQILIITLLLFKPIWYYPDSGTRSALSREVLLPLPQSGAPTSASSCTKFPGHLFCEGGGERGQVRGDGGRPGRWAHSAAIDDVL